MNLYAESSAVLAWLLDEADADTVRVHLSNAELVFASDLTRVECDRSLHRAVAMRSLAEADAAAIRSVLNSAAQSWNLLHLSEPVLERASRPFPEEPLRTLDAIHLATTLVASEAAGPIVVLSLDDRVRRNARALGFEVRPGGA